MQKLLTFFQQKNISIYAIFNDQSFNDTLTNDIVSFEQLGPGCKNGYNREILSFPENSNTLSERIFFAAIFKSGDRF